MKKIGILSFFYFLMGSLCSQHGLQLAPPIISASSTYFSGFSEIDIQFGRSESKIIYRIVSVKRTSNWRVFRKPFRVSQSSMVEAFVKEPGLEQSNISSLAVYERGIPIKSVNISPSPHSKYPGTGSLFLYDQKGGSNNHNDPAWCGFNTGPINIHVELAQPEKIQRLVIHVLDHPGAWIHLPALVEIYDNNEKLIKMSHTSPLGPGMSSPSNRPLSFQLEESQILSSLHLRIYPLAIIPKGNPGEGQHSWLFIDEVNIY